MVMGASSGLGMIVIFQLVLVKKLDAVIKAQKVLENKYMGAEIQRPPTQQPVIQYIAAPTEEPMQMHNTGVTLLPSNQMA